MATHQPISPIMYHQQTFSNYSKRYQQPLPSPQIPSPQNISFNSFSNENNSNNKYNNGNQFNRRPIKHSNSSHNQYPHNAINNHRRYSNLTPPPQNKLPIIQQQSAPSHSSMHYSQQLMPPLIHQTNGANFNELMMADMAKKAFEAAFNQYQQQQHQHQPSHLQPPSQQQPDYHHNKFNSLPLKSNYNPQHPLNKNSNRRY
jgi:hypothetical protein